MSQNAWFNTNFRRNLVDMHIEDWDETFLSQIDPQSYVSMLKKGNVKGAMVYANSHVGLCYWPTKVGEMHRGLKGSDFIGEVIDLCHKEGMDVIVYYSLIYDNRAYEHNPSWRIVDISGHGTRGDLVQDAIEGKRSAYTTRYGTCCPNSKGYRDFTVAQIQDLCSNYDFEGVFFDMTFWTRVCHCQSCKERYAREVGGEIPTTVDWSDPVWVAFQKKRVEWLNEYAQLATSTVKRLKPAATVNHQFSTCGAGWQSGVTEGLMSACDYAGGDFYGGFHQQSFICKLLYSISPNRPFEFHTSRCRNLQDHTTMKSRVELRIQNALTLSHFGATLFIDAIDPVGTLNPAVYDILGDVFREYERYEPYVGGRMCRDVAIYYSQDSKMDPIDKKGGRLPHLEAAMGAARTLSENHIPYGVIGKVNLKDLSAFDVLVLPDVLVLSEDEAERIREYVRSGGSLYASGRTSPALLADVFGIWPEGQVRESVSYIAPNARGRQFMSGIDERYPLTVFGPQIMARARDNDEVLATITLPCTDPADGSVFASIHSNPPTTTSTSYPATISRSYGKGKVVWVSAPIEASRNEPHKRVFVQLVKPLSTLPWAFELDGPPVVEVTVFDQPEHNRCIVNLVNAQDVLPPVPVDGMLLKVRVGASRRVMGVRMLPDGENVPFSANDGIVEVIVPRLEIYRMMAIDYAREDIG